VTAASDEDAALIAGFLESGRVEDFERLVERHQQRVFRVIVAVLGPGRDSEAEDVTQDVFVQVFRRLGVFEGRSRFSTWLYRIAYNRAIDARRSLRARPDSEALVIDPAAPLASRDLFRSRALGECLSRLPDAHRTAIHLHYWLGHTIAEIAAGLGVQPGTAKAWLFRGRHLVARCLASKGVRP
jgi:RNA polymerase sigma-70 factor (ECF subfamily)